MEGGDGASARDADFLGLGDLDDDSLLAMVREICTQPVSADGLEFDPGSVQVSDIREGAA